VLWSPPTNQPVREPACGESSEEEEGGHGGDDQWGGPPSDQRHRHREREVDERAGPVIAGSLVADGGQGQSRAGGDQEYAAPAMGPADRGPGRSGSPPVGGSSVFTRPIVATGVPSGVGSGAAPNLRGCAYGETGPPAGVREDA
jgi:hypothetical protein